MGTVKWFSLVLVVCFLFTGVLGNLEDDCKVCDEKKFNLTAETAFPKLKELIPRVWAQNIPLTALGQKYKGIILDLAQNGDVGHLVLAALTTLWFNKYIPFLNQKPDGCVMAAIVNATLSCAVDHDQSPLQDALTQFQTSFPDLENNFVRTMIFNGGCDFRCGKSPPDPKLKKTVCYKNGLVYPIKNLWNLPGPPYAKISPKLKNVVFDMYKSKNFVDNFLAVCTSFSLAEPFQKSFGLWNSNIIFEAAEMVLSPPIKQKCCYTRIKTARLNGKTNIAEAIRTFDILKEHYRTTDCQPESDD